MTTTTTTVQATYQPSVNAAAATPVVGSNVVMQSRRLYVGNIPFGVSEVNYCCFFFKVGNKINVFFFRLQ